MQPTERLKHEHQVILLVLGAAEREAEHIQATGSVDVAEVEKMVDFIRNFADRCHHAKEEGLLFARMEERGMPTSSGPIAVMLQEHDEGRRHVRAIAEALPQAAAGDPSAAAVIQEHLVAYAQLLRAHIAKEDNILYPIADRLFTPADQQALSEAFDRVEAEEMGGGVHERYHQLAHELAGR
jgi:hemerythrin-like domain-containing protein